MNGRDPGTQKWRLGAAGALLCAVLGLGGLFCPGGLLANWSYDLLFAFRSDLQPPEVMIVYMDDDSHRALHQPWFQGWDRELHARLIGKLTAAGARAVVFDILFDLPNTNRAAADRLLVEAARASGRVVVAGKIAPIVVDGEIIGRTPTPPFDALRAVTSWGVVEAGVEDRTIRRHYVGTPSLPSLAFKAAQLVMPNLREEAARPRWMNYYGPPGAIPSVSYAQLLETNAVPAGMFSNKVVYVGALFGVGFTGGRGTDDFRTPYSSWTGRRAPGVEINATACANLLRGDWLKRVPPWAEVLLVLASGGLLGSVLTFQRPWIAAMTGGAIAILVLAGAAILAWRFHTVLSWLVVGGIQVPAAVIWSGFARQWLLARETRELATQLAAEKSGAAASLVQFTVVSPSALAPGASAWVVVWAYREKDRDLVLQRLQMPARETETAHLPRPNAESTALTLRVEVEGAMHQAWERSVAWSGRILEEGFRIAVPRQAAPGPVAGLVTVYAHGLKVATLRFGFVVGAEAGAAPKVASVEHRPRRAVACYASADRDEVLARIQGMQTVMPELEVFMDVVSLRPGQDWERRLREEISSRDCIYLFWSRNAAESKEVEKEWRWALETRGRGFIEPVPLVSPEVVPPPPELAGIHFNDWTLAFRRSGGSRGGGGPSGQ